MSETGAGELLMNGKCPYNYQCKAVDCMRCIEAHHGEKEYQH